MLFRSIAIPSETADVFKIIGIIVGFTGIVIIFSDSFSGDITSYLLGMIAIVLSATMQAGIAVTIKKQGKHLNPLAMNLVPMLIAGVSMIIISFLIEDLSRIRFDMNAVISIIYLAFFGSVITFTSYYWLMKRINIVILSFMAFITPIIALFLGYLVYDEELSIHHFIGSSFVLIGILTANISNIIKIRKRTVT